jgi:hypothetical protein
VVVVVVMVVMVKIKWGIPLRCQTLLFCFAGQGWVMGVHG